MISTGRPPTHQPLTARHHVLTWKNGSGRTRGLYAQKRGKFVQAQISGYSYRTRAFIFPSWDYMAWACGNLSTMWGRGWTPTGLKARAAIEASA